MEIGKNNQVVGQAVANAQQSNSQQVDEKAQATDSNQATQQDFQVDIKDGLKTKLAEFAILVQGREQLIKSLPEDIRKAVVQLLAQLSSDAELPQGLVSLLKGQKNITEQLKNMGNLLDFAAVLNQDEHSEIKVFLQKANEGFTKQAENTPEQSAKELLQLAKQLSSSTVMAQGNGKQTVEQLQQQTVPENMQQLSPNEQQVIKQLTKLLAKDTPARLQQLAPDMSPEETIKGRQLEEFVKALPPEISKALPQVVKQMAIPDSVRVVADKLPKAGLLDEQISDELQFLVGKVAENLTAKSSSRPADVTNIVIQLVKQWTETAATIEQVKTLIEQVKSQLFASDPKLSAKEQPLVDQLTKLFEKNIPQTLQEVAVKHKLTELPKLWVVLQALGAEQWQNIESQKLQKSASVIKELAQSMNKSTGLAGEKQVEHSTISFSVSLHVAEGIYYPAHIHIYHQQKNNVNQPIEQQFETWLRICVDTENIGMVESVFRLYGDNKLDVRVNFPNTFAANEFTQDLPSVRKSLNDTKLNIADIIVNKV